AKPIERQQSLECSGRLLTISARSESALRTLAERYAQHLADESNSSLDDICFTANAGRAHWEHRLALAGASRAGLRGALERFVHRSGDDRIAVGRLESRDPPRIAFLFPGDGRANVGIGRILFETQPGFRQALERCETIANSLLGRSLLELLYPAMGSEATA